MPMPMLVIPTPTPVPSAAAITATASASPAPTAPTATPVPAPGGSAGGGSAGAGTQGGQQPVIALVNSASAQQRQVLTQTDEMAFETKLLDTIEDDKRREDWARFRDQSLTLTWPLLVLIGLVMYRRTIETIALTRKWTLALPGGLNIGVDQLGALPPATTVAAADASLQTIATHAQIAGTAAPAGMLRAAAALNDNALQSAVQNLDGYFRQAASKLLASQLMLLRATAAKDVDDTTAWSIFLAAVSRGLPLTFEQWLAYPLGYRFIQTAVQRLRTTYAITALGREFLTWCDANGITEASLQIQGRGA